MDMQETISRINELSRIQKSIGLNEAEREEQAKLREVYLTAIKASLRGQLDNIEIVDEDPKS